MRGIRKKLSLINKVTQQIEIFIFAYYTTVRLSAKLKVNSYLWKPISQTFGWLSGRVTMNSSLTQLQLALTTGQSQLADSIKWQSHHHSVNLLSDNRQHTKWVSEDIKTHWPVNLLCFAERKRGKKKKYRAFSEISLLKIITPPFHCSLVWHFGTRIGRLGGLLKFTSTQFVPT